MENFADIFFVEMIVSKFQKLNNMFSSTSFGF